MSNIVILLEMLKTSILQVDNAYVLLWDFADLIHPMLKLESPHEIFCFRFNPSTPGVSSIQNIEKGPRGVPFHVP